ncbi:MAG: hypothetical protein ABI662_03970 [Dermatophilaceae bacterium]
MTDRFGRSAVVVVVIDQRIDDGHRGVLPLDPKVPLVRITREFDVPPGKVFRAHTDPQLVAQWLGPGRS